MKLDIIFAGAARDEQQEGLLLDLLAPLGICLLYTSWKPECMKFMQEMRAK